MAADLNRVTLVGRLTRDPELRTTSGGQEIANMRLAVTSRGKDDAGNWTDKSNFFDVTIFGKQAETAGQYLSKGRRIGVDGRLSWREWEGQDGSKRQTVEVIANDVFFLDSNGERTERPAGSDLPVDTRGMSKKQDDDQVPF
jgi:single-strand DNA-binding protein